jgi:DNA polymerase-4
MARRIIHLDMDAFYASVEVLDDPSLKGKPVVVGWDSPRGVVSAASYEARRFGIHSAMPSVTAKRRCPSVIFLPPRMNRYREISKQIFTIFHLYTPLVEPLSLDEAFLDVTNSFQLFGSAEQIARTIKKQVAIDIGLTVSAGIASSKLIAKIASDLEKPDGMTIVPTGTEKDFLAPLPISKLWGVGKASREALKLLGVYDIGDLTRLSPELLARKFGKHGPSLYYHSLGIDEREVVPEQGIKSVSHEETFETDLIDSSQIRRELLVLADSVAKRLRRYQITGRCITIKVKYNNFNQVTRSKTLGSATDDGNEIFREASNLLQKTEAGKKPVRLLGVGVSSLQFSSKSQISLFEQENLIKRRQINQAIDEISRKFGTLAIMRGAILQK